MKKVEKSAQKTLYAVGFAFDETGEHLLLIKKKRPWWQVGYLNGLGGVIAPNQDIYEAMKDHAVKEANLPRVDWKCFTKVSYDEAILFVFTYTFKSKTIQNCFSSKDEELCILKHVLVANRKVIPDLRWLVPMAYYHLFILNFTDRGYLSIGGNSRQMGTVVSKQSIGN